MIRRLAALAAVSGRTLVAPLLQCEIDSRKMHPRHDEGFIQTVCPGVERGCCVSRHAICKRDGMVHPVDVAFASKWLRADETAEQPASALLGTRLACRAHSSFPPSCPRCARSAS
jgi:hypothetical protein